MPFNSILFVLFLIATAALYNILPRKRRALWLLIVSYLYYFSWSPPQAALLFAASLAAYAAGLRAADPRPNKAAAATACFAIGILGVLAIFKYSNALALIPGAPRSWSDLAIPIGISYYTFKLLSYVLDVYWGRIRAEKNFIALAVYASYFPQILSGPIGRAADFLPALAEARSPTSDEIVGGIRLILFGWFEKAIVADRLAAAIDWMRANPWAAKGWPLLVLVYAYSWRLYADFAGLTDMAIGASRLFALPCPPNFSAPFYARNIQEFWLRWHMSLTSWLRDYLFQPLRTILRPMGDAGLYTALMATFLVIGLWHGAAVHFLVFGAVNGVYMIVSTMTLGARNRFFERHPLPGRSGIGALTTFHLVGFAMLFFFLPTLGEAFTLLRSLLGPVFVSPRLEEAWGGTWSLLLLSLSLLVMEAVHLYQCDGAVRRAVDRLPAPATAFGFYAAIIALILLFHAPAQSFIYMKF